MVYDYGFGKLENELIDLFNNFSPDFTKANELLIAGADINAVRKDGDDNLLSTIICEYSFYCKNKDRNCCKNDDTSNIMMGSTICEIIHFFLAHGFDVKKYDGLFGAQCLYSVVLSSFDRYIIKATKILFNAGAKNRPLSDDDYDTPLDFVESEGSYQGLCENNHALENIYEALYQVYKSVDNEIPYNGIDSYECAIGKKILQVLASHNKNEQVFYQTDLKNFKKENCFTDNLYFVFDDGVLQTTEYADFWVNTELPDNNLVDVSEFFPNVVGSVIKSFSFNTRTVHKGTTSYTQPITTIKLDCDKSIIFSINFGDVEDKYRCAFFEIK